MASLSSQLADVLPLFIFRSGENDVLPLSLEVERMMMTLMVL